MNLLETTMGVRCGISLISTLFLNSSLEALIRDGFRRIERRRDHLNNCVPTHPSTKLEIFAACCRVATLSGAGEHIDKLLEDLEDTCVLSQDGSSTHILSLVLQQEALAKK
ncbi:hypothetical protein H4582DRAFT_1900780 [Lactarius indigo]|nr:hypothetical protein H4582DRAFT_1900780 [Lactarius indigo]